MSSAPPAAAAAAAPAPTPGAASTASAPTTTSATTTKKKKTATKATGAGTKAKNPKPPRKKKPAGSGSKASGAASSQAIMGDARAAQVDLAKQRAQAAARRADPLWYRMEDVLPVVAGASPMSTAASTVLPEQVVVVEAALGKHGLARSDVTPQAMACLLEQARRFAQELVANAQDYAYSANRPELTRADLMLAYEMRPDHPLAFSTQVPKLNLVSLQVNREPLPPIPSHCYSGIVLPPVEFQLTARTYDVVRGAQVEQKRIQAPPAAPRRASASQQPTYGAARGRQIPVKLKEAAAAASLAQETPVAMDTSSPPPPPPPAAMATTNRPPGVMGGGP